MIDILRPVFRKDEETAWTIVRTGSSSKRSSILSIFTGQNSTRTSLISLSAPTVTRFAFENDLFLAPVYKRLLLAKLCDSSSGYRSHSRQESASSKKEQNSEQSKDTQLSKEEFLHNAEESKYSDRTKCCAQSLALMFFETGFFSTACVDDAKVLKETPQPRCLMRRHLPLSNFKKRHEKNRVEQTAVDSELWNHRRPDLLRIAEVLDNGADINCKSPQTGYTLLYTLLEASISRPTWKTISSVEYLLLYREVHIPLIVGQKTSILHFCMRYGNVEILDDIPISDELLRFQDEDGSTALHQAVEAGDIGLYSLKALNRLMENRTVNIDSIVDSAGQSALSYAVFRNQSAHARELALIGGQCLLI